jgi:hypothetical protein
LERAIREMQDFGVGFVPETGAVRFRGEGWPSGNWPLWAGDAQGGTVLKAYREHLCSTDGAFLRSNWRKIRKSLEFLIAQDTDGDGLIKGAQHNTYDINFFGPNTLVGALYLGALRAGEEMAKEMGAPAFAALCRKLFTAGSANSVKKLFNGEYFIQQVDLKQHPRMQYVDGCLADQLFGQSWAHQVALGYLYPQPVVRKAMESIWKYDWAPDVGPQDTAHPPQRWFARPGEAGLLVCTWPKSKHPGDAAIWYRDEVWTGIEYQVAAHMVWEGMLQEGLAICRGIHERYHPARHNPWNEVECGDHYARAMASYGVFLALCGFQYHGPQGRLGFAPRMTPENFRAAFTAADGWGALAQQRKDNSQLNRIELKWGHLRLKTLTLELPAGTKLGTCMVTIDGRAILASVAQDDVRLTVVLAEETRLGAGNAIELKATYGPSQ